MRGTTLTPSSMPPGFHSCTIVGLAEYVFLYPSYFDFGNAMRCTGHPAVKFQTVAVRSMFIIREVRHIVKWKEGFEEAPGKWYGIAS